MLDSEEEFSEDSPADSDRTRRLGDWDEEEPKKKKVKVEDTKTVKPKEEEKPEQNLKQMYWDFVHEEQKRLKKAHPDMSGKDILKSARGAYTSCIQCNRSVLNT